MESLKGEMDLSEQNHRLKYKFGVTLVGAALFLGGCGESKQTTTASTEQSEAGAENKAAEEKAKIEEEARILAVKEGTLAEYPDKAVGEAFDLYFSSPEWDYDSAEEKEFVEFTGHFLYEKEDITASIQLSVDETADIEIDAVSYNGVAQSEANATILFTSIFEGKSIEEIEAEQEAAEETSESEQPEVPNAIGVGTPFPLGTHLNELSNYYGQSTYDDYFMGGRVVVFNDADGYVLDEAETVVGFLISNPAINIFGTYVGMTPAEIAALMAEPAETFFDESETQSYVTYYTIENFKVSYFSETEQGPTTSVLIMEIQ